MIHTGPADLICSECLACGSEVCADDCPSRHRERDRELAIRRFESGATRDTEEGKYDYEGMVSPLALQCLARYMHRHRRQSDGTLRASDNWQKGFPDEVLMKSALRHLMDWWLLHRGHEAVRPETGQAVDLEDALCGLMFNVQAALHQLALRKAG